MRRPAGAATTGSSERRIAVAKPGDAHDVPPARPAGSRSARAASTRGEDRHRVVGEPLARRGQAHPPARRLDQRRPRLAGEDGELLRDRRGRVPELVGDRAHRPEAGQLEQQRADDGDPSFDAIERYVHKSDVDVNGRRAARMRAMTDRTRTGAGMALVSMICVQLGTRRLGRALRRRRPRGRGVPAARLGRPAVLLVDRPAAPRRVHAAAASRPPSRSASVDRRRDDVLHGRDRPAAAGHRERARVPRPARRRRRCAAAAATKVWPALAAVGVLLLTEPWHGALDPVGVAFALAAAVCWAAYIVLTQRVGDEVAGLQRPRDLDAGRRPDRDRRRRPVAGGRPDARDPRSPGSAWRSCCRSSRSRSRCSRCAA